MLIANISSPPCFVLSLIFCFGGWHLCKSEDVRRVLWHAVASPQTWEAVYSDSRTLSETLCYKAVLVVWVHEDKHAVFSISGVSRNRKGGFQTIEHEVGGVKCARCAKFGVTPTSGAGKLGKIPFSARGSPILDCVELLRTSRIISPWNSWTNYTSSTLQLDQAFFQ